MPRVAVRLLGALPTGASYAQWYDDVKRQHGVPVALPSNVPEDMQPYVGRPAARYDMATYVALGNSGQLDLSAPQVASNANTFVYVVAPQSAWVGAPQLMTTVERAENAIFSTGDAAAGAVGLPTLAGVEDFLKDTGKQIVVGIAVTAGVAYLVKRFFRR